MELHRSTVVYVSGSVLYFEWDALQEELVLDPCMCHALSFVKALILPVAKCSENKMRLNRVWSWVRSMQAE